MPKVIAVAFADIHLHKFRAFNVDNSRLHYSLQAWATIARIAKELEVPVLFAGDLFHNPKEVENQTMSMALKCYNANFERQGINCYAISGNHDMSEKNSVTHTSPTHLDSFQHFKTFKKLDWGTAYINKDWDVCGLPYFNSDKDIWVALRNRAFWNNITKKKILLIHSDLPGAVTPEGFTVNETEFIKLKHFKDFNIVLSGHIHKPQKLGKNIYMLGSPIHQNLGDEGNENGYWLICDDGTAVFKPLSTFPKFRRLKQGEKPYNDLDYFIEPTEVLAEESAESNEFSLNNSRKKLAKQYCASTGIKKKAYIRALTHVLNQAE